MQTQDAIIPGYAEKPKLNYLTNGSTIKSWLLTKDHKRIAIMYLITVSLFFLMGGLYAATIRLENGRSRRGSSTTSASTVADSGAIRVA